MVLPMSFFVQGILVFQASNRLGLIGVHAAILDGMIIMC